MQISNENNYDVTRVFLQHFGIENIVLTVHPFYNIDIIINICPLK